MYSYSKLNTYLQCPRKYKYHYLDKVKAGTFDWLVKGKDIHKELEDFRSPEDLKGLSNCTKNFILGFNFQSVLFGKTLREYKFYLDKDFKPLRDPEQAFYGGVIDLVYTSSTGLVLVDYKTGKYKDLKYQDFWQLMSYALFFFNHKTVEKITLRYLYVEHLQENTLTVTRESIPAIQEWILGTVRCIEDDQEFKPKTSILCDYCQYKNICEKL